MSMILDALSRAEKERQAENTSVLDTGKYVQSSTIKDDRFKKWVLIALVANFVLIVLIVGGVAWKSYYPSENTEVAATQENASPDVEQQPVQSSEPASAINVQNANQQSEEDVFASAKSLAISSNKTSPASSLIEETKVTTNTVKKKTFTKSIKKVAVKNPPVKYSSQPLSQPSKTITNESIIAATIQSNSGNSTGYTNINDLSVSQRSQLSQYEVNVHVYDDDAKRSFVLINMIKYKEGDILPGSNALVSSIVPEGVVIDYGGGKALLERTK